MSSFASAKGPSITVRFPPEYLMRQPFELGCSPEASSSTPAFKSSSWYLVIAAMSFSSGMMPASVSLLALTIIMNRIVAPPCGFGFGARLPDGLDRLNQALLMRRTRRSQIDTSNDFFAFEEHRDHRKQTIDAVHRNVCGSRLAGRKLTAQRDECAQPVVAQEKASPDQHADIDREKDVAVEWVADAQVGSGCAAKIAC